MAVVLWLWLALAVCSCLADADRGCMQWDKKGDDICCNMCYPGNRLFKRCGQRAEDLCTPCDPGRFTTNLSADQCTACTRCSDSQVELEKCTPSSDTVCGCKEGLLCGNDICSVCVVKCEKGYEPTENRSCRPCPHGTFNDQSHQKCKPWRTRCPYPHQFIAAKGDAFSDIKCENDTVNIPDPKGKQEKTAQIIVVTCIGCITLLGFIIIIMALNIHLKQKTPKKAAKKTPIIRTPTDEPRTLVAIECSFHEAQQEQGSSSESLLP